MPAQGQIADPTDRRCPEENGINVAPKFDVVGADRCRQSGMSKTVAERNVLHDVVQSDDAADIGSKVRRRHEHPGAAFDRYVAAAQFDFALYRAIAGIVVPEVVVGVIGNPFFAGNLGAGLIDGRGMSSTAEHQQSSFFVGAQLAEIDVLRVLEFPDKGVFCRRGTACAFARDSDRCVQTDDQSALPFGAFDRGIAPIP